MGNMDATAGAQGSQALWEGGGGLFPHDALQIPWPTALSKGETPAPMGLQVQNSEVPHGGEYLPCTALQYQYPQLYL